MPPGIQKLNIPKTTTTSPKAAIANNLRSAKLSSGTAYGIFAQRSTTGLGLHLNNKLYGSASISATRHELNDNRVILNNNIGNIDNFHKCNHNSGNNTMNKFMAGMMATNMLGQLTAQTVDAIKGLKSESSNSTKKEDNDFTNYDTSKFEMSSKLSKASSFKSIDNIEKQANSGLQKFQENYGQNIQKSIIGINDALNADNIKGGLDLAGVNLSTDKLKPSNLSINPEDLSSLDTAAKTIDKDIKSAEGFITADIAKGIATLTSKSGELATTIGSLQAQIDAAKAKDPNADVSQLENQLKEAKENKEKVDNAKKELEGTVTNAVKALVVELQTKLNELGDIKQVKSDLADKKYEVAKDLEKDINSDKKQMDKLESKISKAKTDDEKNKLIKEFNGLIKEMQGFNSEVQVAGNDLIKNSKGKNITLSNIDSKYLTEKPEISSTQSGAAQKNNEPAYIKSGNLNAQSYNEDPHFKGANPYLQD